MTSTTKQSESLVTCNITGFCAVGGVFMVGVSSSQLYFVRRMSGMRESQNRRRPENTELLSAMVKRRNHCGQVRDVVSLILARQTQRAYD